MTVSDEFDRLRIAEPELAYSMLVVDMVMKQRGISTRTMAEFMGVSHESVAKTLRFSVVQLPGDTARSVSRSVYTQMLRVDELDDALTQYCDANDIRIETTYDQIVEWQDTLKGLATDAYTP